MDWPDIVVQQDNVLYWKFFSDMWILFQKLAVIAAFTVRRSWRKSMQHSFKNSCKNFSSWKLSFGFGGCKFFLLSPLHGLFGFQGVNDAPKFQLTVQYKIIEYSQSRWSSGDVDDLYFQLFLVLKIVCITRSFEPSWGCYPRTVPSQNFGRFYALCHKKLYNNIRYATGNVLL